MSKQNETKSDLNEIIVNLDDRIVYYQKQKERHERELARISRLFMQLYEEKHTLDMRFGWLETAGRDVVTACVDHRMKMIEGLADELGIELSDGK